MKRRRMDWLATADYDVLAALLLADGEYVRSTDLAHGLVERRASEHAARVALRGHALNLARAGVPIGERYLTGGRELWYRLTALPDDEHLEPMLARVPVVKRSAWWAAWCARIRRTA